MNSFFSADLSASAKIDQHQINSLICAVEAELTSRAGKRCKQADFLIMGGGQLSGAGRDSLASFACQKNWNLLYAAVNTAQPVNGFAADAIEFSCFVTDGFTSTAVLSGGKLWKRERTTAAILIFPQHSLSIRVNAKGKLTDRKLADRYHDHGHDLARDAVLRRVSSAKNRMPVLGTIGNAMVVHDLEMIARTHEFA